MANEKEATFAVRLDDDVSDSADGAASSIDKLRASMQAEESTLKTMAAAMRRLRGSSDEVKSAKEELRTKINAARDSVSQLQLKMLKAGDASKDLATKTKALGKEKAGTADKAKNLGAAINAAGGPVAALKSKLGALSEIASGSGGSMGVMTLAVAGAITAIAALAAAVGTAFVGLAKFIFQSADAARSANLLREAAAGSAENAAALGTQVDALANKVATSKDALNQLAVSMAKGGIQGQTLVDTLNAVGQANAALGDDAGSKVRELVDRGRLSQRFAVNPLELQGTGLQFDDIAKSLATKMHVGVDKAKQALAQGAVKLGDGAAALRDAVEKKFGDINLRKMLSLEGIATKLREKFATLTSGVNLEPALKALAKMLDIFDDTTVTGDALKQLITGIGTGLVNAVTVAAPIAKKLFQGMLIGALTAGIAFLELRNRIRATFGDTDILKGVDLMSVALTTGKVVILGMAAGLAALIGWLTLASVAVYTLSKPVIDLAGDVWDAMKVLVKLQDEAINIGKNIVSGLINGITGGIGELTETVTNLAERIKGSFTGKMKMHSPSKVFAEYGENTVAGYEEGIESRTPDAAKALDSMADPPRGARGGAGASGGISIPITINVNGGDQAAAKVSNPNFQAQLQKLLEDFLAASGLGAQLASS